MSEIENNVNNESKVGQLFGLFGLETDQKEQQVIEKEDIDIDLKINEESIEKSEQIVKVNEEINENECYICKSNSTKYRCPKCLLNTCSLKCCQTHKQQFNCNGIRDKLKFIKMTDYSQQEFISDYLFLEETERTIDNNERERRAIISSRPVLPKWLLKLVKEARLRGIRLKIMPAGFQKRKQNTTCFMYNEKSINWDIECKFPHALDQERHENIDEVINNDLVISYSEFKLISRRIPENKKLSELISKYIAQNDSIENIELNRKLSLYRNCDVEGITVLFKLEFQTLKNQKYIELDLNKTIKDNLFGKTVIEFPTFVVILNKFKHLFYIISDESNKT